MASFASDIAVVDDDPDICAALRRLLGAAGHEVRTFQSAGEFLAAGREPEPGCMLIDLRLPDLNGIELYQRLRAHGSTPPVIFMSGYGDIPTSVLAMKSGAMDFLSKPASEETLMIAIENALAFDAQTRDGRTHEHEIARRFASLTPRELEVLRLVMAGRLNKQIAREMHISEKTVKVHRGHVMAKMGVRRVAQLVKFVMLIDALNQRPMN
jgi:FixJ family two-component response regulator